MHKFFYYYNSLCSGANTPTAFSFDPYIVAIKEMLISELQQIVYYIEKLKSLNIDMSEYRDKVIEFISTLIVNLDFTKEGFFVIVQDLYNNKKKLEDMYISLCSEHKTRPKLLAVAKQNLNNKEGIIKALNEPLRKQGSEDTILDNKRKVLYELMINIIFNACNCLIELKNYDVDFSEAKDEVLKLINLSNESTENIDDLKQKLIDFSKWNYKIVKQLNTTIIEKFGPIEQTQVNLSYKKGQAILVSGTSFLDLESILKETEGTDINVYTHGGMLNAHEYKEFKKYKNLKGHYQLANSNVSYEFAEFPGPIYISRNSVPKIDVIRGQIYTSARYPAYGIAKIENDNFKPIIDYAVKTNGFYKDSKEETIKIGYSTEEIEKNIDTIAEKINKQEIKHLFIIGLIDMFNVKNEYITRFYKDIPDDCFAVSFAYNTEQSNVWHVNSYFDFPILYNILEKFAEKTDNFEDNVSVFLSDCNSLTISQIFNLMYLGVKNIFLGPCCPNIINPIIIDGFSDIFNINLLSEPKKDINKVIKKKK